MPWKRSIVIQQIAVRESVLHAYISCSCRLFEVKHGFPADQCLIEEVNPRV